MLAFILATTLRVLLPGFDSDSARCGTSAVVCVDLDSLHGFYQCRGSKFVVPFYAERVRGLQGQAVYITVPTDSIASAWFIPQDWNGNRPTCWGAFSVNVTVGGVPLASAAVTAYYDILGRRIAKPAWPGVYWVRTGATRRRLVVWR